MFGHLKAEDFVNLLDGAELADKHRRHIESCARCRATWESVRSVHGELHSVEADIPEPEWEQFRSSVRDELLSRSVQRQVAVRRWTGWAIRPAVAWALSLFMAIGITTVMVVWKIDRETPPPPVIHATESPTEVIEAGPEHALFDDLVSLGEEDQEKLRQMLESEQRGSTRSQ